MCIRDSGTTGLGKSVGTSVEGQGQSIDFMWIGEHPWAATFQQTGRLHLYAQYRRDGQAVEEDLGAGKIFAQRQMRFTLPKALRAVPEGPVCLFFGTGRNSSAVPVRSNSASAGDTAGFRYQAWEANIRTTSSRQVDEKEVAELSLALPEAERRATSETNGLAALGVRQREDCSKMMVPTAGETVPKDVFIAGQQTSIAQRICVRRARNQRNPEYINTDYKIDVHEAISQFRSPDGGSPQGGRRQAEVRQFLSQWQKWIDQTGVEYVPEVGSPSDFLPTVGTLDNSIKDWNAHRKAYPGTPAPATIVNGILDAYKGCLEDVSKQLAFKLDAWQKARANQPARDRLYAERKRSECVGRVEELDRLKIRIGELRTQLAETQTRVAAAPTVQNQTASRQMLNGESCQP